MAVVYTNNNCNYICIHAIVAVVYTNNNCNCMKYICIHAIVAVVYTNNNCNYICIHAIVAVVYKNTIIIHLHIILWLLDIQLQLLDICI